MVLPAILPCRLNFCRQQKKQATTNAACSFSFSSSQPANSRSILPAISRLSSSIANAQISRINPISFFALTLKRKAPAADSFNGHYRFYAIIHPFRNEEHMVTILDFVHSTFVLSVHIILKHISTSGSMRMPSFVSGIAGVAFSIIFVIIFISFLFDFRYCRHILSTLPICRILPAAKHRQNAKAPLPAKTAGLKNKERNEHDGESVLCIEEILLPHLLYILYQIFRQAQIFVGFFFAGSR